MEKQTIYQSGSPRLLGGVTETMHLTSVLSRLSALKAWLVTYGLVVLKVKVDLINKMGIIPVATLSVYHIMRTVRIHALVCVYSNKENDVFHMVINNL